MIYDMFKSKRERPFAQISIFLKASDARNLSLQKLHFSLKKYNYLQCLLVILPLAQTY